MRTLSSFALVLAVSAASLMARADQAQYVARDDQALAVRSQLIESARKSLDLAYFIYEPCQPSTQLLVEELAAKSRQGVRVRIIIDAFLYDAGTRDNISAELSSLGIEVRFYNQNAKADLFGANMRSHIKFLLADDEAYTTGGRNMADDYFGLLKGINFIDRDILVRGASGRQAAASFAELWNSSLVTKRKSAAAFIDWKTKCGLDVSDRIQGMKTFLRENQRELVNEMPVRSCENVRFLTDSPDFSLRNSDDRHARSGPTPKYMNALRLKLKRTTDAMVKFIKGTNSRFEFENWSYIPVDLIDDAFRGLRERGVEVFGITNSAADSPGQLGKQEVYQNAKFTARDSVGSQVVVQMALGGRLDGSYALTPEGSTFRLHGKVAVRDNRDVMVGSYNLDPRSYHTNLESMVIVENCPALAADVEAQFKHLRRVYERDVAEGHAASPADADLLTKIVGIFGFQFL